MMRHAVLAGVAGGALIGGGAANAVPTTEFGLSAGLNAGYSSNPYLEQGDARGSPSASISLSPVLVVKDSESTTTLQGGFNYLHYFNDLGHSRSLSATVSRAQTFSSALSGNLDLSAADSTSALLNPFQVSLPEITGIGPAGAAGTTGATTGPIATTPTLPSIPTDIIASRQRVRSYSAQGGLAWKLDALDTISGNANVYRSEYPGRSDNNVPDNQRLSAFTSWGGGINYNRIVSPRTTLGATLSLNETHSGFYPDARTIQPSITGTQRLSDYITASGSIGAIFSHQDAGVGLARAEDSTSLSFSASLCGTYPRLSWCANAGRQTSASGYGGLRVRTSAGANFSYQLDERSAINGTAGWARDAAPPNGGVAGVSDLSLVQADVGYSRQIASRLSLTASVSYQRQRYSAFGTAESVSGSAGLSYYFGRTR